MASLSFDERANMTWMPSAMPSGVFDLQFTPTRPRSINSEVSPGTFPRIHRPQARYVCTLEGTERDDNALVTKPTYSTSASDEYAATWCGGWESMKTTFPIRR